MYVSSLFIYPCHKIVKIDKKKLFIKHIIINTSIKYILSKSSKVNLFNCNNLQVS